jgi:hypothetical protein
MRTSAQIVRSFGVLLMRGSVIRNAERTANGTKQHYNPCVADDSAGCVSYANVLPHHRVWSVYIVREVHPHCETRKKYIGAGRGATTRNSAWKDCKVTKGDGAFFYLLVTPDQCAVTTRAIPA